jgi:hypothetical protein
VTEGAGTFGTAGILRIAEVVDPELWRFTRPRTESLKAAFEKIAAVPAATG